MVRHKNRPSSMWYTDIRREIVRLFGDDADLFCDLLAATSPRTRIKTNWNSALQLYNHWKSTGQVLETAVTMKNHRPNIERAFNREPLSGEKVKRFAANLKGDTSCVTIDVWICRHYGIKQKSLTPKRYAKLEQKIQKEATKKGMLPSHYQAQLWQEIRTAYGKQPKSFLDMLTERG